MTSTAQGRTWNATPARLIDAAGIGVCVLLLGAGYMVGLGPRLHERARAAEWRDQLERGRTELARLTDERHALLTREARLVQDLRACDVKTQSVRELNRRVQGLVSEAGACGLQISECAPGTPAAHDKFTLVPIKLRGTGSYEGVSGFLARLHASFPDTAVVSLSVATDVPGESTPEFSVELAWYAAPDGTARASAPVPSK